MLFARSDGKARILLKRHEDGSLGIGIKGGKEYNAPIVVYLVEPGSQAAEQVGRSRKPEGISSFHISYLLFQYGSAFNIKVK